MQDGLLCSLCKAGKGILGARELRVLGLLCCTMQDTARLGGGGAKLAASQASKSQPGNCNTMYGQE